MRKYTQKHTGESPIMTSEKTPEDKIHQNSLWIQSNYKAAHWIFFILPKQIELYSGDLHTAGSTAKGTETAYQV